MSAAEDAEGTAEHGMRTVRPGTRWAHLYAYHDYPLAPWRSPLYLGGRLGRFTFELHLPPESPFRPLSGGAR